MRHLMYILSLVFLFITACDADSLRFIGESDNWEGQYNTNIEGDSENGQYIFGYKDNPKDIDFKKLEININNGEKIITENNLSNGKITTPTKCTGCLVTNPENPIEVTIKWGGDMSETFMMEIQ